MNSQIVLKLCGFMAGMAICLVASSCKTHDTVTDTATEKSWEEKSIWTNGSGVRWGVQSHDVQSYFTKLIADLMEREEGTYLFGEENLKRFFTRLGVGWPEGSSIMYVSCKDTEMLHVTNTLENQKLLKQVLDAVNADPRPYVEIIVQVMAFRTKDVEKLQLAIGVVDNEALFDLQKAGKARLVATSSAVTKNQKVPY